MAETVEVSGAAPMVDTTQSKVAVTVRQKQYRQPAQGPFLPVADSVRPRRARGTAAERRYHRREYGFQIDGASDSENVYMIDGVNTTNIQNGGVGKSFQMDFVEEVQVKIEQLRSRVRRRPRRRDQRGRQARLQRWHGSLSPTCAATPSTRTIGDRDLAHQPEPAFR